MRSVFRSLMWLYSFYVTRYKEGIIIPKGPVIIIPLSNPFSIGGATRLPGAVATIDEKIGALSVLENAGGDL